MKKNTTLLAFLVLFVDEIRITLRNPEIHYLNRLNVTLILDGVCCVKRISVPSVHVTKLSLFHLLHYSDCTVFLTVLMYNIRQANLGV